jgi:hypothetical protein
VRLPRDISPGAAARRALLADFIVAIGAALVVSSLAAGVGVVAFLALPTLLVLLAWIAIEKMVGHLSRHRKTGLATKTPATQDSERSRCIE